MTMDQKVQENPVLLNPLENPRACSSLSETTQEDHETTKIVLLQIDKQRKVAAITLQRLQRLNASQIKGVFSVLKTTDLVDGDFCFITIRLKLTSFPADTFVNGRIFNVKHSQDPKNSLVVFVKVMQLFKDQILKVAAKSQLAKSCATNPLKLVETNVKISTAKLTRIPTVLSKSSATKPFVHKRKRKLFETSKPRTEGTITNISNADVTHNLLKEWAEDLSNRHLLPLNWFVSITGDGCSQVLNIYELVSKIPEVALRRCIRVYDTGLVDIQIDSRPCTDRILEASDRTVSSLESLVQLIYRVKSYRSCLGCVGFENLFTCPDGFKEGTTWYSNNCDKVFSVETNEASCSSCQRFISSLKSELCAKSIQGSVTSRSNECTVLVGGKVDLGKSIFCTLRSIWNELELDKRMKEYATLSRNVRR